MRAGAAAAERFYFALDARANVEHAGAERAEQAFVAGGGQQIDVERSHVDRHMAQRLGGIDQEERSVSRTIRPISAMG